MTRLTLGKLFDYFLLSIISVAAIVASLLFNGDKAILKVVIISYSALYFFWGVYHHFHEKSTHHQIILEYFLFSVLGAILLVSIL